jgi:hypothetical protein
VERCGAVATADVNMDATPSWLGRGETDLIERRLIKDSKSLDWTDSASFILSHRHLTEFFDKPYPLTESDCVIGLHYAYGWMPTILDFKPRKLGRCLEILNRAKARQDISDGEISMLTEAVNGSLVGTSKLLNFIDPSTYAIWDSNVCEYLKKSLRGSWGTKNIKAYRNYLKLLKGLSANQELMKTLRENLGDRLDATVSDLRLLEMIMFLKGRKLRKEKRKERK